MANKGQFKKGQSGNPKGRTKGIPNKSTQELRTFLQGIMSNNIEQLQDDLMKMSATNRWSILERLAKYYMPSLTRNENENNNTGEIKISVEYLDNNEKDKADEQK